MGDCAMARAQGKLVIFLGAIAAAALFRSTVFVPPPSGTKSPRTAQLSTAACAAALLGAADNAHADAIGDAAGKLSKAAYPFMKEVPWNSYLYSTNPGSKDAVAWTKAIDKMIVMGSAMDGAALKEAAQAHVKAIDGVDAKGVLSQGDFEAINAGLGKAIASVPTSKVMDVFNSMSGLIGSSPVPN